MFMIQHFKFNYNQLILYKNFVNSFFEEIL